jgi:hypothetical protein
MIVKLGVSIGSLGKRKMTKTTDCPAPETLVEFLTGRLDEGQLRQVESHLAECDACGDTVRSLHVEDTFVDLLRSQDEDPLADAGGDMGLQALMVKL